MSAALTLHSPFLPPHLFGFLRRRRWSCTPPPFRTLAIHVCTLHTITCIISITLADLTELDLPSTMKTNFPNAEDLLNFELTITPDDGTLATHLQALSLHGPVSPQPHQTRGRAVDSMHAES